MLHGDNPTPTFDNTSTSVTSSPLISLNESTPESTNTTNTFNVGVIELENPTMVQTAPESSNDDTTNDIQHYSHIDGQGLGQNTMYVPF